MALQLFRFESIRALKFSIFDSFRVLKCVGQIGAFQGPKILQIGEFQGPKFSGLEGLRTLKFQRLSDMAHEPRESNYIKHIPENMFKLFSFKNNDSNNK